MRAVMLALTLLAMLAGAVGGAGAEPPKKTPAEGGGGKGPAAPPPVRFTTPVIFTVALGSDAALNQKITVALAKRLRAADSAYRVHDLVVPEGSWGLNDVIAQCHDYPEHVHGAVVVMPAAAGAETTNRLVIVRTSQHVEYNAVIAQCATEPGNDNAPHGRVSITWASDTASGEYGTSAFQFLPFAVLTSVYLAFAPQRTFTTTSTSVFPTPNPLPPGGARSNTQTQSSTVLNASGTGSLQSQVVNAVGGAQLAFGRQGSTEHLQMHAAEDAAGHLIEQLRDACAARKQAAPPPAAPAPSPPAFCSW